MRLYTDLCDVMPPCHSEPTVVAIGVFDGLHLAHREVVDWAVATAREQDGRAAVFTFSTFPSNYFCPDRPVLELTPFPLRMELLAERGVDVVVAPPFDRRMASVAADVFIHEILKGRLGATHISAGFNFCFGTQRAGTSDTLLSESGRTFQRVRISLPINYRGEPVSSTRVRKAIQDGDLAEANGMLGHPYSLFGRVVHGDARGGPLGIPTANVEVQHQPVPPPGIFGSRTILENGNSLPSLTYVGSAPTFQCDDNRVRVETMLLGDPGELYEQRILVEMMLRIRDEVAFSGPDELVAQIRKDEDVYRHWLEENPLPALTPFPAPLESYSA